MRRFIPQAIFVSPKLFNVCCFSQSTHDLLVEFGVNENKTEAVLSELSKTGLSTSEIPSFIKTIGSSGLQDFVAAVDRVSKNKDLPLVSLNIHVPKENLTFKVSGVTGESLRDISQESDLGSYLECACSGVMACSTCHVILDKSLFDRLDPPCEAELDMLDLAYEPQEISRLGCQLILSNEFENATIIIPNGVNNYW
mmetsp:Transcript_9596/g.12606  ORF Transcript_9596/g.12606 Transcript_9596/m.12606 type:complete len:197 (-) Transcript_9596:221-811(-)